MITKPSASNIVVIQGIIKMIGSTSLLISILQNNISCVTSSIAEITLTPCSYIPCLWVKFPGPSYSHFSKGAVMGIFYMPIKVNYEIPRNVYISFTYVVFCQHPPASPCASTNRIIYNYTRELPKHVVSKVF